MKTILKFIDKIRLSLQIAATIFFIILGLLLNHFYFMPFFLIKLLLVLSILNLLIHSIRYYNEIIENVFNEIAGDPILNANKEKFLVKVFSKSNILISSVVGIYFVTISVLLDFIDTNFLGYIALIILFVTVFISIIGYLINVYLINFIMNLSKSDITNYSTFYPANTRWLVTISKLTNYSQNVFFVSGSMYIVLFSLFTPTNTIDILSAPEKYFNVFVPLFFSWLIIVTAVILGFPVTLFIKNFALKSIVENLKYKSILEFEGRINYVDPEVQVGYVGIIKEIKHSEKYPFDRKANLVIPSMTTILNIITITNTLSPGAKYILEKLL